MLIISNPIQPFNLEINKNLIVNRPLLKSIQFSSLLQTYTDIQKYCSCYTYLNIYYQVLVNYLQNYVKQRSIHLTLYDCNSKLKQNLKNYSSSYNSKHNFQFCLGLKTNLTFYKLKLYHILNTLCVFNLQVRHKTILNNFL